MTTRRLFSPVVGFLAVFALAACDEGTGPADTDAGSITVTVTADGSGLSGVSVELYAPSGTASLASATTGSAGEATFGGLDAGSYDVEVEEPTGYVLDAGDDRQSVTVSEGGTASVSFALAPEELPEPTDTVEVVLTNYEFTPGDLTVAPNTLVRWVNDTNMAHTVTPDGHGEWSEASLSSMGATFEHVFGTEGTFDYYCSPHLSFGMEGSVTVQAP